MPGILDLMEGLAVGAWEPWLLSVCRRLALQLAPSSKPKYAGRAHPALTNLIEIRDLFRMQKFVFSLCRDITA